MSRYKVDDIVYGCYYRPGAYTTVIQAAVKKVFSDGNIEISVQEAGIKDTFIVHENSVRSTASCHNCIHRLSKLSGGCSSSYIPIK